MKYPSAYLSNILREYRLPEKIGCFEVGADVDGTTDGKE